MFLWNDSLDGLLDHVPKALEGEAHGVDEVQAVEGMRQGEDQMEIRHRQERLRPVAPASPRPRCPDSADNGGCGNCGPRVFAPAMRAIERLAAPARRSGTWPGRGAFPIGGAQAASPPPPARRETDAESAPAWGRVTTRAAVGRGPAVAAARRSAPAVPAAHAGRCWSWLMRMTEQRCTTVISTPASSRCVAKEWRKA